MTNLKLKLLIENNRKGVKRKGIGELAVNKGTISFSKKTVNAYGLKQHLYFSISALESGKLVALFSQQNDKFLKIAKGSKTSAQVNLNGNNRKGLASYIGNYQMEKTIELMNGCECFLLNPILN